MGHGSMASMLTPRLSWFVSAPMHQAVKMLDLFFGVGISVDLEAFDVVPQSDHFSLKT